MRRRPVLLKGFVLASRIYPDPFLRPTSDVDLLLAPEELELACSAPAFLSRCSRSWLPPGSKVAASRRLFSAQRLIEGYLGEHKGVWAAAKLLLEGRPDLVALFALRRLKWNARLAVSRRLKGSAEPGRAR